MEFTPPGLSLRKIFSGKQQVTAPLTPKDGRTMDVRKTAVAEQKLQDLHNALGLSTPPLGTKKVVS